MAIQVLLPGVPSAKALKESPWELMGHDGTVTQGQ